jgi:hypothetical protein
MIHKQRMLWLSESYQDPAEKHPVDTQKNVVTTSVSLYIRLSHLKSVEAENQFFI